MVNVKKYLRTRGKLLPPLLVREEDEEPDTSVEAETTKETWGERSIRTPEQQRCQRQVEKLRRMLGAYQVAINAIDDRFEYRLGSTVERQFLNGVFEKLTHELKASMETYKDIVP